MKCNIVDSLNGGVGESINSIHAVPCYGTTAASLLDCDISLLLVLHFCSCPSREGCLSSTHLNHSETRTVTKKYYVDSQ